MIGTGAEASAHSVAQRHSVEELSREVSNAVRAEWAKQRTRRAVGFLMHAKRTDDTDV